MNVLAQRNPEARHLVLIIAVVAFLVVSFWDSFSSVFALWEMNDHRHGVLVLPIAAFLIWRLRAQIANTAVTAEPQGLLVIVALLLIWSASRLTGIQVTEHLSIFLLIPTVICTIAGRELTSKLLFPLLFIVLATPIGDSLVPHLMIVTADISSGLLRLSGVPVFRDGQYISLPGGEFVVADVCSGIRYLVTGIMVALLYSYLTYQTYTKRLLFTVVAAVVLVITNGVRAFLVMAIASASDMQYLGGRDHIYFGWILFGIVIMGLMWVGMRYAEENWDTPDTGSSDAPAPGSIPTIRLIVALGLVMLAVTINQFSADTGGSTKYIVLAGILLGLVLLLGRNRDTAGSSHPAAGSLSISLNWRSTITMVSAAIILIVVPQYVQSVESAVAVSTWPPTLRILPGCVNSQPWSSSWMPRLEAPDFQESNTQICAGHSVSLFMAGYSSALQGKELISDAHQIYPANWGRHTSFGSRQFKDGSGGTRNVNEILIDSDRYRAVIWYWYSVDGRWATGGLATKVLQIIALARQRPAGGHVFLIETPVSADEETARQRLQAAALAIVDNNERQEKGDVD